ncbi:HlyD family secretion protein [Roseiconus lacunae]|uniref:Efflux RND transporter periplasmic adaptor subunit n=1 Tax=Roseiconus lacunae TaxID=2605694 RepID=A0ABT7PJ75_9BACT|nr:efflux RND transporter periplasmic adaptor subunit [Roseiconus lacunae]MCD0461818.1 efflux RND transporter periplasmic adaptor subunit [Roseiconus lacunae]MDM4016539.1 efflux RND transporter periplasmic adaptor subunit [Roseiconus lacunae]WRQ49408.1 efflux RND transporter periplasmic adaptor subunit [Stieleria sp. HD01]
MRQLILAGTLAAVGTGVMVAFDQQQLNRPLAPDPIPLTVDAASFGPMIHAAGRVEGRSEPISIRPHFPGRIETLPVASGTRVSTGEALLKLDSQRYEALRDLAAAQLEAAQAKRMRLVAGARPTEIEAARQNAEAALARYEGARNRFERAAKLFNRNAISAQEMEDYRYDHDSSLALLNAARKRFETVKADPRPADLLAADAAIASAKAELRMAEIDLDRCQVKAPCDAIVLDIDVRVGEWISPENPAPALQIVDASQLRVVADVDERDALIVSEGKTCRITVDALPGKYFEGIVSEIEPRMEPKKIYGGWAGERNDTHSRRVWIDLANDVALPIGIPVEVMIERE